MGSVADRGLQRTGLVILKSIGFIQYKQEKEKRLKKRSETQGHVR
jgi:hypothetical protein